MQDWENERDEALVERAKNGDNAAAEALLLRYKNAVRARARGFFLAGGETDDLVQEGMVGLYSAIVDYSPESGKSFKNCAYLCVTRRILDAVKGAVRNKNIPLNDYVSIFDPDFKRTSEEATPEDYLLGSEARSEFRMLLMKELSDFEFRVVTMYLEGLSYAQISEATGKDFKSIDNALARSKKKLQRAFSRNTKA